MHKPLIQERCGSLRPVQPPLVLLLKLESCIQPALIRPCKPGRQMRRKWKGLRIQQMNEKLRCHLKCKRLRHHQRDKTIEMRQKNTKMAESWQRNKKWSHHQSEKQIHCQRNTMMTPEQLFQVRT
jgi:hypothetical protein